MSAILQVENLKTVLDTPRGEVRAVDGVDIELRKGECFALVGESGCGKSMTALSILRLLPEAGRIVSGRVGLGGHDLLALPEALNVILPLGISFYTFQNIALLADLGQTLLKFCQPLGGAELGDPRAIPNLERARRRMHGGLLGIGRKNANRCLSSAAKEAIEKLEKLEKRAGSSKKETEKTAVPPQKPSATYEDFTKLDMRVGEIKAAEPAAARRAPAEDQREDQEREGAVERPDHVRRPRRPDPHLRRHGGARGGQRAHQRTPIRGRAWP